jgi:hypothetical protein
MPRYWLGVLAGLAIAGEYRTAALIALGGLIGLAVGAAWFYLWVWVDRRAADRRAGG